MCGQLTELKLQKFHSLRRFSLRRPKSKANIMNEPRVKSSLAKFDNGFYSRLQFLRAISHPMGAHTVALQPADSDRDDDDDGDDSQ